MRSVSNKSCKANQNTHFIFTDFFSENRAFYENMENSGEDKQDTDGV